MLEREKYVKYSTPELMELVDLFHLDEKTVAKIQTALDNAAQPPDAKMLFRHGGDSSKVLDFENAMCEKFGCEHAVGVNSGTSALITALHAVGVGPGDEVIIPAYTFIATAMAVVMAKAIPVIVDIDESLTISPEAIEKNITERTKAIIPVHIVGHPADMDSINAIAKKHDLYVVEDAAQACGGTYKGRKLGTIGDIGCFSLNAFKVITSGEGGVVVTDNDRLYHRALAYHDSASNWRNLYKDVDKSDFFCGQNYRMTELCGAVAVAQIRKLDWIIESGRRNFMQLRNEIQLPDCAHWVQPNDVNGVCGHLLGIIFDTKAQALAVGKSDIGIGGLAASADGGVKDWHVAWNWVYLRDRSTADRFSCPFTCPHAKDVPDYNPDSWEKTKNILMRCCFISIRPTDSPQWISQFAARANAKFKELF